MAVGGSGGSASRAGKVDVDRVTARLASAPAGVEPFRTRTGLDRTRGDGALGADLFGLGSAVLRADVFGNVSANGGGYGGNLKLQIPF